MNVELMTLISFRFLQLLKVIYYMGFIEFSGNIFILQLISFGILGQMTSDHRTVERLVHSDGHFWSEYCIGTLTTRSVIG